ncbi:hypothetical protein M8J76_013437 [Diaphorina citri]|nr:hypothetical protein M8J75_008730 [Diaphorina citri]KAI5719690.1 hypothetical protein M8J76_013437 [Diaphorina citri]KAI5720553.1 hypothetical protein M8J77_008510 [Diaphorina citri]
MRIPSFGYAFLAPIPPEKIHQVKFQIRILIVANSNIVQVRIRTPRPHGAHIPDDLLFFALFFVFGFFSTSASSSSAASPASSAAPSPTPSHATSPVPSPAPSPVPSSPPHPNPPAAHFELVPDVELTPRGPRISVTFEDPDAVPFMSDTDSDSDSCVPTAPAAEQEHQDPRAAASDSDSEVDWSGVRPMAPRFTLSLPHGDSLERTRQRTADTVAAVIGWVASNVDFIPPTYPRRRPRRLPRGRPKKYKKRAQEP